MAETIHAIISFIQKHKAILKIISRTSAITAIVVAIIAMMLARRATKTARDSALFWNSNLINALSAERGETPSNNTANSSSDLASKSLAVKSGIT